MLNIEQLNQLSGKQKVSFTEQRKYIKSLLDGSVTQCRICQKSISVLLDDKSNTIQLSCDNGCTDFLLEL
ncbi:hypothetical protein [Thalassotalea ganghwensis]